MGCHSPLPLGGIREHAVLQLGGSDFDQAAVEVLAFNLGLVPMGDLRRRISSNRPFLRRLPSWVPSLPGSIICCPCSVFIAQSWVQGCLALHSCFTLGQTRGVA